MTIVRTRAASITPTRSARPRASARGDVQWLTAGKGIVHSEMFPLLDDDDAEPARAVPDLAEPARADKMVEPYFTMLWDAATSRVVIARDDARPHRPRSR